MSVERNTFPGLLAGGARVWGHVDTSYWLDLGTPATFVQGSADLVRGSAPTHALPRPVGEVLALDGAVVAADAVVTGGTTLGRGVTVGSGARVEESVLFDGAVIGERAQVIRSVIGVGAKIGAGTLIRDAVIGDRAVIGPRCELIDGARVWPDVVLGEAAIRFSADAS